MSGLLPINDFVQVTLTSNQPTMTTTSISGMRQAKQVAAQFWTIEADYRSLDVSEAKSLQGFLAKQRGTLYDFAVILPDISYASGGIKATKAANPSVDSSITIDSDYSIGTATISFTTNYTESQYNGAGATTIFQAGDFINFAGHTKVYQVVEDVTFDSAGNGSMTIFPSLVEAVSEDEEIYYDMVQFRVFNTETAKDTTYAVGFQAEMSLKLQEAL